jgi:stalled ribosome rescue protein Dom34
MGQHVAVWMDSEEARVFHVGSKGFDESTIHSPTHHVHRHPKDQLTRTHNYPDDEHRFFHALADTLKDASHILLLGPAVTKVLFLRYLEKSIPALGARIVGLETADHPTDRQIATHIRVYFESGTDGVSRRARP